MSLKPILIDLPTPVTTTRLLLRPPKPGDGKALNAAVLESFEELKQWMPWAQHKPSLEESEEFVRKAAANWILKRSKEPWLSFFIFDKDNSNFVGAIGFHHINWNIPCLELGYWLRNMCVGQGFITEAASALTEYAIKQMGVKRIEIRCDLANVKSRGIPEKLGYHLEATLKGNKLNLTTNELGDTLLFVRHNLENMPTFIAEW